MGRRNVLNVRLPADLLLRVRRLSSESNPRLSVTALVEYGLRTVLDEMEGRFLGSGVDVSRGKSGYEVKRRVVREVPVSKKNFEGPAVSLPAGTSSDGLW